MISSPDLIPFIPVSHALSVTKSHPCKFKPPTSCAVSHSSFNRNDENKGLSGRNCP